MSSIEAFKSVISDLSSEEVSQLASDYVVEKKAICENFSVLAKEKGLDISKFNDPEKFNEEEFAIINSITESDEIKNKSVKSLDKLNQLAQDKGISISNIEIETCLAEMQENDEFDDLELSNEALEIVSGGGFWFAVPATKAALYLSAKFLGAGSIAGGVLKATGHLPWYTP